MFVTAHPPYFARIYVPPAGKGLAGHYEIGLTHQSRRDLLTDLEARIGRGRGFAVATLNLDHVVKLRHSARFREAYDAHSHIVADGNPIVWLARMAGQDVKLTPGSELVLPVAEMAARTGVSLGLFGGTPESLAQARTAIETHAPDARVANCLAPPVGFDPDGTDAEVFISTMQESDAAIWLLALGAPKQEILASRAFARMPDRGFLSVGAGLDFIAGCQRRAPGVVRSLALEWAWRMAGDPARLAPRYGKCIAILPKLAEAALLQRSELQGR
ncbi:WecB/TagA/CpsF family glycosyltransferase [Aliiruegeria haliotis]|uniref:WecB/TagA/CpsF family glycosyltransferase n=1 Tax=Aliiruegeria haliotis TaxID=1280846 RepID=UPI001FE4D683|nr:WecB/TagA/CpsF family glycosyltransferase [Aliiruegeria haliotis]